MRDSALNIVQIGCDCSHAAERPATEGNRVMADVNRGNRPLSPHLTIYRPQMTSMTSIFVRITGNALIVAALMIVWWFAAAATGPEAFATADAFLRSWFGDLVLFLSVWAMWYHLLGGVRHLIWDTGRMLKVEQAETLGLVMIIGSVLMTIFTIIVT
ncbi:succinate dehydrogenase subunit C [Cognatiyoonia sediminum]|uniref:Succinate dehydrogenase cytochrome b556 subunit n=2 Tax=Cognatiyoonia sediminum TaxID=1508389 RepID=A0A1M5NKG3_9RHOB|nr:succinate dehydrogenase subunit C [Cognatiyoonia sediminum]